MKKAIISALSGCVLATAAFAVPEVNEDYVRSLAAPGKTVLVIEYYDGAGNVAERKGYAATNGYKAISGTDFRVDDKTALHLYGLEPCKGNMVNRAEDFAGTCEEFATQQLQIIVEDPKVLFCRAFISEQTAPLQDVTCYVYVYYPNALDAVYNLEEQLLSVGAVRLTKKRDGSFDRPDLAKDQDIGRRGGYGMWADPRVQAQ